MTYQNRQSSFMLVSTDAIKRGSMKIDPPDSDRTRSQAVRSTSPIELKTRFVYGMGRRYLGEAQRKRAGFPSVFGYSRRASDRWGNGGECLGSASRCLPIA